MDLIRAPASLADAIWPSQRRSKNADRLKKLEEMKKKSQQKIDNKEMAKSEGILDPYWEDGHWVYERY
ncbi:hypothetical protein HW555_011288, partial [Spodoptera exigua]